MCRRTAGDPTTGCSAWRSSHTARVPHRRRADRARAGRTGSERGGG
jgi:hypothetical protein